MATCGNISDSVFQGPIKIRFAEKFYFLQLWWPLKPRSVLTFSNSETFAFWGKFALSLFWWKWDFIQRRIWREIWTACKSWALQQKYKMEITFKTKNNYCYSTTDGQKYKMKITFKTKKENYSWNRHSGQKCKIVYIQKSRCSWSLNFAIFWGFSAKF